jgi:fatty-acyl-CoA synthase
LPELTHAQSYTKGPIDKPLIRKTIGELFDEIVSKYEDNEALVSKHQQQRFTYAQLKRKVDELAISLLGFGVKRGDRVGIWSPNNTEWVLTQFAMAKIGAILVNINPAYRVSELEYALNQSGVSFLITARQFKTSDYHSMIYELAPEMRKLQAEVGEVEIRAPRVPELRRVVTLGSSQAPAAPGMISWRSGPRDALAAT